MKRILCLLLVLLLWAAPALADTLVVEKIDKMEQTIQQIQASDASVVDVTATSLSPANIRLLMDTFPQRTF